MNAILLLDKEARTEISEDIEKKIVKELKEKGHPLEIVELGKEDANPCIGCWLCMMKHPGICVIKDRLGEVRRNVRRYDMVIFLTPVIFGHWGSTVKCAIDRSCSSRNITIMLGYGSDITDEEKSTFVDLTRNHLGAADIVHPGLAKQVDVYITTSMKDNVGVHEAFKRYL